MTKALELYRPTAPGPLPVLLRPCPDRPKRVLVPARAAELGARVVSQPPELVREPPVPWTALRTGIKKLNDGYNDTSDRIFVIAGGLIALTGMVWYPWLLPLLVVLGWLTAVAYGVGVVWLLRAGEAPWKWTPVKAVTGLGFLLAWGVAWLARGAYVELVLTSFTMAQLFAQRTQVVDGGPSWAKEKQLIAHWTDAGLLGAKPPEDLWFRRLVPFHQDEDGMQTLTVVPMVGPRKRSRVLNIGAEAVEKARPALERVMGLKVGQLHVTHDDEHDAAAITLTVTRPVAKASLVKAIMPARWDYNQPLFIGRDHLGKPHYRRTWGCHSGWVAMTQKGKTASVLYDLGHAVVDPHVPIYLLDFKGDDKDFKPLRPLCKRAVTGASLESARRALSILEELHELSESRTSLSPEDHGVVVVVDEWFRLLSLAQRLEPELGKQLDSLLTELMATSASRRIKFISLFQGGTGEYINKPMRVNIGQRFCGVVESTGEVRYFLETVPSRLPKQAGQFVFKDDGVDPVLVNHPYLDPAGFARQCELGAALRRGDEPVDPLTAAVHELLALEPLKASVLLSMLPAEVRPDGATDAAQAQRLGYLLKKMDGVEATTIAGHKHYRLTPGATPVTAPSGVAEPTTDGGSTGDSPRFDPASSSATVAP